MCTWKLGRVLRLDNGVGRLDIWSYGFSRDSASLSTLVMSGCICADPEAEKSIAKLLMGRPLRMVRNLY
jgi:hypothetical protein